MKKKFVLCVAALSASFGWGWVAIVSGGRRLSGIPGKKEVVRVLTRPTVTACKRKILGLGLQSQADSDTHEEPQLDELVEAIRALCGEKAKYFCDRDYRLLLAHRYQNMAFLLIAKPERLEKTGLLLALVDVIKEAQQARAARAAQASGFVSRTYPPDPAPWLHIRGSPERRHMKPLLSKSELSLPFVGGDRIARDLWSVTAQRFKNRDTREKEVHPLCYYVEQSGSSKTRVLHEQLSMLKSQAELHPDDPLAAALRRERSVVQIFVTFGNETELTASELFDLDTALYLRILHAYFDGRGLYGEFDDFVSQLTNVMGRVRGSVYEALRLIRKDISRCAPHLSRDEPAVILLGVDDMQAVPEVSDAAGWGTYRRLTHLREALWAIWGPSAVTADAGFFYIPLVAGGSQEDMIAAGSNLGYLDEPMAGCRIREGW